MKAGIRCLLSCCIGALMAAPALGDVTVNAVGPGEAKCGQTVTIDFILTTSTPFLLRGYVITPPCALEPQKGSTGTVDTAAIFVDGGRGDWVMCGAPCNCGCASVPVLDAGNCQAPCAGDIDCPDNTLCAGDEDCEEGQTCTGGLCTPPLQTCGGDGRCEPSRNPRVGWATIFRSDSADTGFGPAYLAEATYIISGDASGGFNFEFQDVETPEGGSGSTLRDIAGNQVFADWIGTKVLIVACVEDGDCDDGDSNTTDICNDDGCCEYKREQESGCCCHEECGGDDSDGHPVYLFSGEYYETVVDLRIPGRGEDFSWERKYRSKIGPNTAQGNGWDFSYNIRLEQDGQSFVLFDGNTRQDTYELRGNILAVSEFYRVLLPDLTLSFPDTSTWNFNPFNGTPEQGKIKTMTDRNGNTLSFDYNMEGLLVTIHDTLDTEDHDRDITITYNTDGFIESVTDFAGRSVRYEYYDGVESGGNFGDLKSVTTPPVVNTPPEFPIPEGHDYPDGKKTVYTYTTGFEDERLNHDLLTITDPKGQTYLTNVFAHTVDFTDFRHTIDPSDFYFDRVVRQIWGDQPVEDDKDEPGDIIDFVYEPVVPSVPNHLADTQTIVNDRVGNVTEYFFTARNLNVRQLDRTGRADPHQPTTEISNQPMNQLRKDDPPFFESLWEYNDDARATRITDPNGNVELITYDPENRSRRSQGNIVQRCRFAGLLDGDQGQICEVSDYNDGFNFVTRHVDGRGNVTLHGYDAKGNRCHTQHRIPQIVEDMTYNQFGQMTSHTLPDNGSGHRRMDVYTYYDSGHQLGYLKEEIIDAPEAMAPAPPPEACPAAPPPAGPNFALTTTYEYNLVGQVTRVADPRGHDTQYIVNQLDQTVREISREATDGSKIRYERDTFYDANDNVVRVDIQNLDADGNIPPDDNTYFTTIHEYEILNYRTRTCEEAGSFDVARGADPQLDCSGLPESEFITTEFEYDANRNRTLIRYGEAVEERQLTNLVETLYDERDLTFREIRAPGDPDQSTTQYDYDPNRNRARIHEGLEDDPRVTTYNYDGYDRLWAPDDGPAILDPMGNVVSYHYDPNSNRVSALTEGERTDVEGGGDNERLYETAYVYDEMDRLIRTEIEFFGADGEDVGDGQSITETFFSENSQVIRVVDDNGHETLITYDTANRRSRVTDAKGNIVALEKAGGSSGYDANSNVTSMTEVEESDLLKSNETFTTTYQYDNLDRLIKTVDNAQNTTEFGYDSRDNRTVTVDALRPDNTSDPGNVTRYDYDGINRLITTTRLLTHDGTGPGNPAGTIVTTQSWDDTSRLIEQADDNGNATTHTYDALNRLVDTSYADGTVHTTTYDVHDDRLTMFDANGSLTDCEYDLLDRLIRKDIAPGEDVTLDTNLEIYKYDGRSRLVYAEDNDSLVTRSYDSLSQVTLETLNDQTTQSVYDGEGNKLSCTYPGGREVTTTYDDLDRKKTISDGGGRIATYHYVGPGRVERRDFRNAARTVYTYDGITDIPNPPNDFGVKRIIRTRNTVIGTVCAADEDCPTGTTCDSTNECVIDDRTYTFDRMYNKTQRKDVRAQELQLTHDYDYDSIYRLVHTTVTDGDSTIFRDTDYSLDGVGNREEVTGEDCAGEYTCDSTPPPDDCQMNQYTTTPFDCRTYDQNGNLINTGPGRPFGDIKPSFCPPHCPQPHLDDILCLLDDFGDGGMVDGCEGSVYSTDLCPCGGDSVIDVDDIICMLDAFTGQPTCPTACPQAGPDCIPQGRNITYDYRNQMVELKDPETSRRHTYAYDALGRRIARVVDADGADAETRYFYDAWQVVEEQDDAGATLATYVYGLYIDEVLNMQRDTDGDPAPEDYYYHTDDLYNVMAITNAAGAVTERYEYADYGQPIDPTTLVPIPGDPSAVGNPYGFTGRRYDPETAWYYYRTRYLDPVAGRFTTRDTIGIWGDPMSLGNGYAYSSNSPITSPDPMGTVPPWVQPGPYSPEYMEEMGWQNPFGPEMGWPNRFGPEPLVEFAFLYPSYYAWYLTTPEQLLLEALLIQVNNELFKLWNNWAALPFQWCSLEELKSEKTKIKDRLEELDPDKWEQLLKVQEEKPENPPPKSFTYEDLE